MLARCRVDKTRHYYLGGTVEIELLRYKVK